MKIEENSIENVYNFQYLGSQFQSDGDDTADVKYRMNIAQSVFSSLHHIWNDHRLPTTMKLRLYQSAVCSSFTHACEAWDITDRIRKKINGFNSRCLSTITNKDLRETAVNPDFDLVLSIRQRRLRYLGHILRMAPDRLVKRTFLAYVGGTESDPPEGSLLMDCDQLTLEELTSKAMNKKGWTKFVNGVKPLNVTSML